MQTARKHSSWGLEVNSGGIGEVVDVAAVVVVVQLLLADAVVGNMPRAVLFIVVVVWGVAPADVVPAVSELLSL